MNVKSAVSSFFNRVPGVIGMIGGGGWYPGGTSEGVAPFRSVGSDAGVTVESGLALQLGAVFACVSLISSTVSTLPLVLTGLNNKGKRVPQVNSSTYRMLALAPNAEMTAIEFWEMMLASICLWGNAYAVLGRIAGRVVSMTPLRPEYMTVARNAAGDLVYRYQPGAVRNTLPAQEFAAADILHVKGFGVDGLVGLSPIAMARQSIGRTFAADQAAGKIMGSGLSASGFIKYENAFKTPEQREAVREMIQGFTGSPGIGKVMVLENGMEYQGITINPNDAQMLETRMFNVEEICRWFRVPPQMIGHVLKSSSWASSVESTTIGFKMFCLRAYLRRIEQAVTRALRLSGGQMVRFDLDELDGADSAARAALDSARVQNGLRTRNELRERDGLDAIDGADDLTVQSNLIPLDKLGAIADRAAQPAPTPPEPKK